MAVKREHHGRGIGSRLLLVVEEWAKEHGFEIIIVKTSGELNSRPYDKTRCFYEKMGFARVALVNPYPEWGESALIYVKMYKM